MRAAAGLVFVQSFYSWKNNFLIYIYIIYSLKKPLWWSLCQTVSLFSSPQVPGKTLLWEKATAFISFVNPLPVALKGGVFTVEGAGLLSATRVYVKWVMTPVRTLFCDTGVQRPEMSTPPPGGELRIFRGAIQATYWPGCFLPLTFFRFWLLDKVPSTVW